MAADLHSFLRYSIFLFISFFKFVGQVICFPRKPFEIKFPPCETMNQGGEPREPFRFPPCGLIRLIYSYIKES